VTKPKITPVRRFKDELGLNYRAIAAILGISDDYARKLGCGAIGHVSPRLARQFERRSGGKLLARELVRRDIAAIVAGSA
jgi:predicted transcriptional regulator